MQPSKSARTTVLAITTALLIAVAIAIACAPTAPSSQVTEAPETTSPNLTTSQDDNGQNPLQAQQTTEQQSVSPQESSPTATIPPPLQPDGDPVIDSNLQDKMDRYNKDKAEHERTGQTMEPVFVDLIVTVSQPENVDVVVVFMKEHSLGPVYWDKGDGTTFPPGGASGYVNIELVPTISLMPGIFSIHEITPSRPTGNPHQSTTPTTAQTPEAPTIEWTPPPPPTGPAVKPVVNTNLQRKLANHVENKANKRAASENLPTVYVELVITVQGPEHVDALVEFMNEHATGWVSSNKYDGTNRNVNGAIGRIDLDLVPTVEAMPGVIEIYEVIPARPASQLQDIPSTTSQPVEVLRTDT